MKVKNIVFSGFAAAILMGTAQAATDWSIASKAYVDSKVGENGTTTQAIEQNASDIDALEGIVGDGELGNGFTDGVEDLTGAVNDLQDTKQDKVAAGSAGDVVTYSGTAGEFGSVAVDNTPTASSQNLVKSGGVKSALDTKTDRQIVTNGNRALIFNESDGGGAKFENSDGTNSFTGVNNGGANGLAAQIYAVNGTTKQGSRLDVGTSGMYYTKTNNTNPSARMLPENEIATKGDITSAVNSAMGGSVGDMDNLHDTDTNFDSPADVVEALNDLDDAINTKQDEITQNNMLDADLVDDSTSTNKFVTASDVGNLETLATLISGYATCAAGSQSGRCVLSASTSGMEWVDVTFPYIEGQQPIEP